MFSSLSISYVISLLSYPNANTRISCDAQALRTKKGGPAADQLLFQAVEAYFLLGAADTESKVRRTELPPIYFQQPGRL